MAHDSVPGLPIFCADELISGSVERVVLDDLITSPLEGGQQHTLPLEPVGSVDGVYLKVTHDGPEQVR